MSATKAFLAPRHQSFVECAVLAGKARGGGFRRLFLHRGRSWCLLQWLEGQSIVNLGTFDRALFEAFLAI